MAWQRSTRSYEHVCPASTRRPCVPGTFAQASQITASAGLRRLSSEWGALSPVAAAHVGSKSPA
eukprot:671996-Amphidinium_carterae.1